MVDFNGINNPELKAKFDKIFADGKVEKSEVKALTSEEQDALMAGLAGKVTEKSYKEISAIVDQARKENEAPSFWKHPIDYFTSDKVSVGEKALAGLGVVAAAVGTVVAAIVAPIPTAIVGGGALLASCSGPLADEPEVKFTEGDTNVMLDVKQSATLGITINVNNPDYSTILKAILDKIGTNADNRDLLESILVELQGMKITMDMILDSVAGSSEELKQLLQQVFNAVETGNQIGIENNKVLKSILAKMNSINTSNDDIKNLLNTIIGKIDINNDMTAKQSKILLAILDKLDKMDANISKKLSVVIDKIDSMGENNYNILDQVINLIKNGNADNTKLLEAILDQVIAGNEQNKDMDTNTHKLLEAILKSINKLGPELKKSLSTIIAKLDTLNANQQASFKKILDAINNNTTAINKNTDVSNGIYALLTQLLGKVDSLKNDTNVNFDAILEAIANISVGGNGGEVDLSGIESLLKQLITQGAKNNEVLNNIDSKIGVLSVVIGDLKVEWTDANEQIKGLLEAILAKIPEGCNCTHETVDLSGIEDLLRQLVETGKDDPKHEGILEDLDKYFN